MIGARSRSGTGYRTWPRFVHRDIWLPKCNRIRTLPGWVEPEVYFRIVHIALPGQSGPDTYREQTVEIALGPKGAFENGNIGPLTRRVAADRVVSAIRSDSVAYSPFGGRNRDVQGLIKPKGGGLSTSPAGLARLRKPSWPSGTLPAAWGEGIG